MFSLIITAIIITLLLLSIYIIYCCFSYELSYKYWKYCYNLTYDTYWLLNNDLIVKIYDEHTSGILYNDSTRDFSDENGRNFRLNIVQFANKIVKRSTKEEFEARIERNKIFKELEKVK